MDSKEFLHQITPKNKLHYFSKKYFLVLGALKGVIVKNSSR